MILFPAIDIKDGCCVRLTRGEYDSAVQMADNWQAAAELFRAAGAEWMHMVDLDGALAGKPVNRSIFEAAARLDGIKIQLGGGLRKKEDALKYLDAGIDRVILGSAALSHPELAAELVRERGSASVAVGIDVREGKVYSSGWTVGHSRDYINVAEEMTAAGVSALIVTDIERDGTLSGPNIELLETLIKTVSTPVIASGGIRNMQDLIQLEAIGAAGAVMGKAVYYGTIDLEEALARFGN
ncbi:MAG TPA: 1-(5-phosphoribosyl)-5-[(5-phosphoribosylamino)methylideneamino]imidazole-4-carboxamide isomerase [Clostridiales bacterium]|jgi:phosphoribosylformimino-5-aminoimidazole carboxamide ribotide isomerase|nr:1-(5-phosphoribosyl)-5-[(5-phosphoribosylamino)methylideneamino]imidazole-4-carboxamide isomerase [Clostridiales bacterium]